MGQKAIHMKENQGIGTVAEKCSWRPRPYDLEDWRIDALITGECTCSNTLLSRTHTGATMMWCIECGRWHDGAHVGIDEELTYRPGAIC